MAKTCESCHQTYADDLSRCPHCNAATKTMADSGPEATTEYQALAKEGQGAPSDVIEVDWNALAQKESEGDGPDSGDVMEAELEPGSGSGSALFGKGASATPPPQSQEEDAIGDLPRGGEAESDVRLGEEVSSGEGGLSSIDRMRMSRRLSKEWEEAQDQLTREARRGRDVQGSASEVDLGSRPEVDLPDSQVYDIDAPSAADQALAGEAAEPAAAGDEEVAEDAFEITEGDAGEAAELAEAPEESVPPPARRRTGLVPWLGGGVAGAVLASAACLTLAFLGVFPGRSASPVIAPPGPSVPLPPPRAAAPKPVAEPPRAYLDRGDFDKVLQSDSGQASADMLAARGEARWLSYVRQQWQKKSKPAADDPAVKQAKDDLEKAKSPEGLFWLGQIQEGTGDVAGARKTYEEGLAKFKDDASRRRMFEVAIDRLEATAPEKEEGATDRQGAALSTAVLALTALQPPKGNDQPADEGEPKPAPKKAAAPAPAKPTAEGTEPAEPEEAGFSFWKAVRLAREGKYDEAVAALHQARAAHEERRFLRLRKSQNPTSDPAEEIFLRSCDELQAAWQLRAQLQAAGIAKAGKPAEIAKAVGQLVSENRELKPSAEALQAIAGKLKQDKQVAAADPELKDPAADVATVLDSRAKLEAQAAQVRQLLQSAHYQAADDAGLASAVDKLLQDARSLREALVGVTRVLQNANYPTGGTAGIGAVVEKLVQDKKATEEKLKSTQDELQAAQTNVEDLSRKVTEVKDTRAEERPDQPVRLPEVATVSSAGLAEEYYGAGLSMYWSGRYRDAARDFAEAIRHAGAYDQDARYFYYYGLAQFRQGDTKDAADAFRRAVLLEQQNKPASAAVNKTLERIQGEPRRFLNTFRP